MKRATLLLITGILLISLSVFANDVVIDENGNVTTGTSAGGNLEVTGASAERAIVGIGTDTGGIGVYGVSSSGYGINGVSTTGVGGYFSSSSGHGLIVENGNVGIGTGNPQYNLHVKGTISASVAIKVNGIDVLTAETDPVFVASPVSEITGQQISNWDFAYLNYDRTDDAWSDSGADVYTTTSGNVGIGTSIPSEKLSVTGTIESTVSTGTAPLKVASSTMVANLNCEMLGGKKSSDFTPSEPVQVPQQNTSTVVDTVDTSGIESSITIGPDGLPVISYIRNSSELVVTKCGNAACSSGNATSTITGSASLGDTSIIIGSDGLPVITYFGGIIKCGNSTCSSGNINGAISISESNIYNSVTVGANGFPVIASASEFGLGLTMTVCLDLGCTVYDTWENEASFNIKHVSITMGSDGIPIVAYHRPNAGLFSTGVVIAKCISSTSCETLTGIYLAQTTYAEFISLTTDLDGTPVVSYYEPGAGDLYSFAVTGSGSGSATLIDSTGVVGKYSSITIGIDGDPIISYFDETNETIKVAKCRNLSCDVASINVVDSIGPVAYPGYTSITIGLDGLPVIAYHSPVSNEGLKVTKCANTFCVPYWTRR